MKINCALSQLGRIAKISSEQLPSRGDTIIINIYARTTRIVVTSRTVTVVNNDTRGNIGSLRSRDNAICTNPRPVGISGTTANYVAVLGWSNRVGIDLIRGIDGRDRSKRIDRISS